MLAGSIRAYGNLSHDNIKLVRDCHRKSLGLPPYVTPCHTKLGNPPPMGRDVLNTRPLWSTHRPVSSVMS